MQPRANQKEMHASLTSTIPCFTLNYSFALPLATVDKLRLLSIRLSVFSLGLGGGHIWQVWEGLTISVFLVFDFARNGLGVLVFGSSFSFCLWFGGGREELSNATLV